MGGGNKRKGEAAKECACSGFGVIQNYFTFSWTSSSSSFRVVLLSFINWLLQELLNFFIHFFFLWFQDPFLYFSFSSGRKLAGIIFFLYDKNVFLTNLRFIVILKNNSTRQV